MIIRISILVLITVFALVNGLSGQTTKKSLKERIIRAELPSISDDDEKPMLQIVGIYVENQNVSLNKPFLAGDDWLETLQIRVKNISNKKMPCIGIYFHLFEKIDTKLKPYESWQWGFQLDRGECFEGNPNKLKLEPGDETILKYADQSSRYRVPKNEATKLAKAILSREGLVMFSKKKRIELPLLLPTDTVFLDDHPYLVTKNEHP